MNKVVQKVEDRTRGLIAIMHSRLALTAIMQFTNILPSERLNRKSSQQEQALRGSFAQRQQTMVYGRRGGYFICGFHVYYVY